MNKDYYNSNIDHYHHKNQKGIQPNKKMIKDMYLPHKINIYLFNFSMKNKDYHKDHITLFLNLLLCLMGNQLHIIVNVCNKFQYIIHM